ncbi:MAG: amidohydrolase [Spirochaetia bacterium]|jgi:5-methylthioadenosine/S-adenosylhomocysteine deaminase|nr:amidohydrolase [Spirochaetia bacterium]
MIIKNISILSFKKMNIQKNMNILIDQGRIKDISSVLTDSELSNEVVIDGTGKYIIPGLVNAHAHTAMTLLRGVAEDVTVDDWFNKHVWIYEQSLTPDDVYVGTLLGAAEMLLSGVTAVADHYFAMDRAFDAYVESGMRANISWAVFGTGPDNETQFETAMKFTKDYSGKNSRISISLGPHSPYICPEDFLKKVSTVSSKLELPMHIHVSETEAQVLDSLKKTGLTPIQVLDKTGVLRKGTILAHAFWATDDDLRLIKERGSGIAHCAKSYMKFGDINDLLPRAIKAGVKIAYGSDGLASNNTADIFEVARDAALLAKCASRNSEDAKISELLPLLNNGDVIGLDDYGEIKEGALADLVIIDPSTPNMMPGNNIFADILYSLNNRNIHSVIVDGKLVVENGKLLTVNVEDLKAEATQIAKRLLATVSKKPMQNY